MNIFTKTSLGLFLLFIANLANGKTHKFALVIGVANYAHANPLKNTLNDANDIASKLKNVGFDVTLVIDPSLNDLEKSVKEFEKSINNADACVVFYSGHGAEYNGENYLFAKDSNPIYPGDLQTSAFPLASIISKLDNAKLRTNIIILDACRSNPFAKRWRSRYEGLANIDIPMGTFIGYAASPGKTASDGIGRNGTYTDAILKFIDNKNISIDQIFNRVNKEVRINSAGKQIPFKNSSLDDDFYFVFDSSMIEKSDRTYLAEINRPRFPMPKTKKGYTHGQIIQYANVEINKDTFSKKEFIEINLEPITTDLWDRTTPIFVSILSKNSVDGSYQMTLDEEYKQKGNKIRIKLSSSFPKGDYVLSVGFYLLTELSNEYPHLYAKRVGIHIK